MGNSNGGINGKKYSQREITDEIAACFPATGPIHDLIHWMSSTTFVDPRCHVGAIIPMILYPFAKRGWRLGENMQKLRLLVSIIANPGLGKSTSISTAIEFFDDVYKRVYGSGYERPFIHASGSIEGITQRMMDFWSEEGQTTACILHSDELSQILSQRNISDVFNQLWDGRDYERNLRHLQRTGEEHIVRQPSMLGVFAGTPSALENSVEAVQIEGGLFSRSIFIYADTDLSGWRMSRSLHHDVRKSVIDSFVDLYNWESVTWQRCKMASPQTPLKLIVDDEALNWLEHEFKPLLEQHRDTRLGAIIMRLTEHIQTVAVAYAISLRKTVATMDEIVPAYNLIQACLGAITGLEKTLGVNAVVRIQERLETILHNAGPEGLSRHEIHKKIKVSGAELDQAIQTLVSSDRIQIVFEKPSPKGGRPSKGRLIHTDFAHTTAHNRTQSIN